MGAGDVCTHEATAYDHQERYVWRRSPRTAATTGAAPEGRGGARLASTQGGLSDRATAARIAAGPPTGLPQGVGPGRVQARQPASAALTEYAKFSLSSAENRQGQGTLSRTDSRGSGRTCWKMKLATSATGTDPADGSRRGLAEHFDARCCVCTADQVEQGALPVAIPDKTGVWHVQEPQRRGTRYLAT